jgi:hypothetical protein
MGEQGFVARHRIASLGAVRAVPAHHCRSLTFAALFDRSREYRPLVRFHGVAHSLHSGALRLEMTRPLFRNASSGSPRLANSPARPQEKEQNPHARAEA